MAEEKTTPMAALKQVSEKRRVGISLLPFVLHMATTFDSATLPCHVLPSQSHALLPIVIAIGDVCQHLCFNFN